MKKILLAMLPVIVFTACSNSLDSIAMKNLEKCINEIVIDASLENNTSVEFVNINKQNVVYSNDSICVIDCDVNIKEFGKDLETVNLEYIFYKDFYLSKNEGKDIYFEWANGESHKYDSYEEVLKEAERLGVKYHTFYSNVMESYWKKKFKIVNRQ